MSGVAKRGESLARGLPPRMAAFVKSAIAAPNGPMCRSLFQMIDREPHREMSRGKILQHFSKSGHAFVERQLDAMVAAGVLRETKMRNAWGAEFHGVQIVDD